ncbi:hypothetical protein FACS1894181_06600 [Bacteroidia bacterium]|nr:hypothetical protein FACS1894181_06600 [Bacteroidia bacterium]
MDNANLVSAVRLLNNLFTDHAGTEVGSDLIILQKNSNKTELTPKGRAFIKSHILSDGQTVSNYFRNFKRVVHIKGSVGTNPYGKPAMEFIHEGSIPAIASDLKKMLTDDLSNRLNKELFLDNSIIQAPTHSYELTKEDYEDLDEIRKEIKKKDFWTKKPEIIELVSIQQQPIISLYDLFVG